MLPMAGGSQGGAVCLAREREIMASFPSGTTCLPQNRGAVREGNRISFVVS